MGASSQPGVDRGLLGRGVGSVGLDLGREARLPPGLSCLAAVVCASVGWGGPEWEGSRQASRPVPPAACPSLAPTGFVLPVFIANGDFPLSKCGVACEELTSW